MTASTKRFIIRPKPQDLSITVNLLARYAGGSRYRMDKDMEKKAVLVLEEANNLIDPALVYSVHDISRLDKDFPMELLLPENGEKAQKLSVCVCTLGPKLETEVVQAMKSGDVLRGMLLDAAGVGMLESLGNLSFSHVHREARKYDLFAGCRFGPGYNRVPMETQVNLFALVDAAAIGVSLTRSLVMIPAKSLSFFVVFYKEPHSKSNTYKCGTCDLKECSYRI